MSQQRKSRTPVTTRRGDGGYTSLWGGEEVPKVRPPPGGLRHPR